MTISNVRMRSSFAVLMMMAFCAVGIEGSMPQRSRDCLESTRRLFGPEVHSSSHLFEVNKDYALELQLGQGCEITKIKVAPKYFWERFNHISKEPSYSVELSEKDYQDVLRKAEELRRLGPLIRKGTSGSVTNSKLWLLDQYERAFVERGVLSWSADQGSSSYGRVHVISIYFLHAMQGKIQDKAYDALLDGSKLPKVKIHGRWYLTTDRDFEKARVGQPASLMAAGPIS
jgi:hypothetical protein